MTTIIDNTLDVIDSCDVIERIEELRDERDAYEPEPMAVADLADPALAVSDRPAQTWAEEYPDEAEELRLLESLQEQAEGYASDWRHGVAMIRDSYFEDYARELAEDLHGDAMRGAEWPFSCIDWEAAANELRQDYTALNFDGVTYWVR